MQEQQQLLEIKSSDGPSLELTPIIFEGWGRTPLPSLPQRRNQRRAVRSQMEIETSILDSCRTPNVQHWIMLKARLGYDTFWKHMNYLLTTGLMEERNEGNRTVYQTSAKGLQLLEKLSAVEQTVSTF